MKEKNENQQQEEQERIQIFNPYSIVI